MAGDPCQSGSDQPAKHVAHALQPPASGDRDNLGHEHLERHALRAGKEAQQ
jgi:hypothetical protein